MAVKLTVIAGTVPTSLFKCISNTVSLVSLINSVGIVPMIKLLCKRLLNRDEMRRTNMQQNKPYREFRLVARPI